jgi:hypothetical protein
VKKESDTDSSPNKSVETSKSKSPSLSPERVAEHSVAKQMKPQNFKSVFNLLKGQMKEEEMSKDPSKRFVSLEEINKVFDELNLKETIVSFVD